MEIQQIKPEEIEAESFRIIARELGPHTFTAREFPIVQRVIHATGDFEFAELISFGNGGVEAGIAAIKAGKDILVDVNMAASGISKPLLAKFGCRVICKVADADTKELAARNGATRSETAMELAAGNNIGIVGVGNAPTALLKVMECIDKGLMQPDLIVGVPVGFVNALESKAILAGQSYPFITVKGRKGGSPINVAIINALLKLAAGHYDETP
ncbi:MAG: precorrin-8X methylmutase [Desulfobulbaceae bacterium]|nr:precorrin-8X methylmutase [Desulfobulbaceae bacterium]